MQPRIFRPNQPQPQTIIRTIADVIELHLRRVRTQVSARTFASRSAHLYAFAEVFGSLSVIDAKPFHLRNWIDEQTQWRSDWTKKGVIGSIQRCFNWASKLGLIDRNPFIGVTHCEGYAGRPMGDDAYAAALRASSPPFRRLLTFLRATGCRPGEAATLRFADVDDATGVVTILAHKTAKQTRRPRVLVLPAVALRLVQFLHRTARPGQQHVFTNARHQPWNRYSIANRWKRLRRELGLPLNCKLYGLRHRFGTHAIRVGVPIKTVSILMGHRSVRTTERYIHCDGDLELLKRAAEEIAK